MISIHKAACHHPIVPEKEFNHWLACGRIFAWRDIVAGKTTSFRVVFLAEVAGKLHCVTRYDTAHGYAHRDVLGITDGLRGKLLCSTMTYNEAFDYAIRDIANNAENYLADFLAH